MVITEKEYKTAIKMIADINKLAPRNSYAEYIILRAAANIIAIYLHKHKPGLLRWLQSQNSLTK